MNIAIIHSFCILYPFSSSSWVFFGTSSVLWFILAFLTLSATFPSPSLSSAAITSSREYFFLSMVFWRQSRKRLMAWLNCFLNQLVTVLSGMRCLMSLVTMLSWGVIMASGAYGFSCIVYFLIMRKQAHIFRRALHQQIQNVVEGHQGAKSIYIEKPLLDLLNYACSFKFQQILTDDHPHNTIILFEEDTEAIDQNEDTETVLFFLQARPTAMSTISSIILRNEAKSIRKKYVLYLSHHADPHCIDQLTLLKIREKVEVKALDWGWVSLSDGLSSLEISGLCDPLEADHLVVESLMKLSGVAGKFARVIGKGPKSKRILEKYESRVTSQGEQLNLYSSSDSSCLIVMDRSVDLVTLMLTGHTYESLLDHFFGIRLNSVEVPNRLIGSAQKGTSPYLLHNSRDPVYQKVAYLSIEQARDVLLQQGKRMREQLQFRSQSAITEEESERVGRLRNDMEQVQNHRLIVMDILQRMNGLHFYHLINYESALLDGRSPRMEEFMYLTLEYPAEILYKLVCLYSQVSPEVNFYQSRQKEILELFACNYSPKCIPQLNNLVKQGLLRNSRSRNRWQQVKDAFGLVPEQPQCYSDVHIMYSALSVRLVEEVVKGTLSPELSALLGAESVVRGVDSGREVKEVYVYYVGGVTYGEVSCLRRLEKELGVRVHVLTTGMLSRGQLVKESAQKK